MGMGFDAQPRPFRLWADKAAKLINKRFGFLSGTFIVVIGLAADLGAVLQWRRGDAEVDEVARGNLLSI